jgi:ribosomal protein S27E
VVSGRSEDDICRARGFWTEVPGARCPTCGHTNLVHSVAGTTVANDECQLCRIEFLTTRLEELVARYEVVNGLTLQPPDEPLGRT